MKPPSPAFTLIEVLVALFIIAIALSAAMVTTQNSIHAATRVKNKIISHCVALNILSEIQIGQLPLSSDTALKGKTRMLKQSWHWSVTQKPISNTLKQITVTIMQHQKPINSVIGYVYQQ